MTENSENRPIRGIGEAGVYVDDLEDAKIWYQDVLGLEVTLEGSSYCFLKAGDDSKLRQRLILFDPDQTTDQSSPPAHGTHDSIHVALGTQKEDIDAWKQTLNEKGVEIEDEITWPSGDRSIYFRDPFDNSLELYGQTFEEPEPSEDE